MESSIVEEDVMLLMVLLQELARQVGSLRAHARQIEHGPLRRREVDFEEVAIVRVGRAGRAALQSLWSGFNVKYMQPDAMSA